MQRKAFLEKLENYEKDFDNLTNALNITNRYSIYCLKNDFEKLRNDLSMFWIVDTFISIDRAHTLLCDSDENFNVDFKTDEYNDETKLFDLLSDLNRFLKNILKIEVK